MRCKFSRNHNYSSAISQSTFRVSNTYTSPFTINTIKQKGPLKLTDKTRSLKGNENWRKLLLLSIQTGDKLATPPLFVVYSRLCRHCRILAEGGCLLSWFHNDFLPALCRYPLSHVAFWNLAWQGLITGLLLQGLLLHLIHTTVFSFIFSRSLVTPHVRRQTSKLAAGHRTLYKNSSRI